MGIAQGGEEAIDLHGSISIILDRLDLDLPSPHPDSRGDLYHEAIVGQEGGRLWGMESRVSQVGGFCALSSTWLNGRWFCRQGLPGVVIETVRRMRVLQSRQDI